ncbi:cellulose synthase-like protein G3 isoform X2 [Aristolochia californica]|uniref:cellulose synthase-like protein G3 isoform X2 n=1 Tax=Aristolochia californica TaxID=171875 RepID=UPI0035D6A180
MGNLNEGKALPLHKLELDPRIIPNRIHAIVYSCGVLALLYHHFVRLRDAPSLSSFFIFLTMLVADIILAFMWAMNQGFRWRPVRRQEFPENLPSVISESEFPKLDVFICTADPYKEPPIDVVNTALSVMAFDYPAEKISVYVSDDGGSELTLFAFMEAAKFARHWLPFCKKNKIEDRCPEAYFGSNALCPSPDLKDIYESMRDKLEGVVEKGQVSKELLKNNHEQQLFRHWKTGFTRQDHPTIIQVLLDSKKDMDVTGSYLPNLVYFSREKSRTTSHNFKAGALNALLRVSGAISNAPLILTLDCDMYSNDPQTPRRALCFLVDPNKENTSNSNLAFVQFPQRFRQIDKNDIYGCEHKRLYQINPAGMDGLAGPAYVGSGCFFQRRAFYGPPSASFQTEADESERYTDIASASVLQLAHEVASCTYEQGTSWGTKIEGWKTVFCNPVRPAFLGDAPITLNDALSQNKRWCIGQLEVGFCKHNPLAFGTKHISLPMAFAYAYYSYWSLWSIPILSYGLLPQFTLLGHFPLFPKVLDPWFYLYAYLTLGAYAQDLVDFIIARGGTIQRWWSDQRIWMMRGASSFLFALLQFSLSQIGISGFGFNVTSKVVDNDQSKRHKQGMFEFGVPSPLFVPPATIAVINLATFIIGLGTALRVGCFSEMFVQIFISGYVVVNSLPLYEAMLLRNDKGKMHIKTKMMALCLACVVIAVSLKV